MNMSKTFEPQSFEQKTYETWIKKGYFTPKVDKEKTPFTIVIPPPNITGQLHMGHALNNTIQDIIIRHKRMQGYSTLWLPGTDHASIATEVKIVDQLRETDGLSKEDIGRDEFLKRAFAWKEKYGGRIVEQLKRLGSSCDWTREAFTMDNKCSKAVKEVFVDLYKKGLIYQGSRIINWCPSCKTALSDAEVNYESKAGHLWHIKYPYADGSGYLIVATTRPETMLGDTAVAVNPKDEKFDGKIGKMLKLPLTDREIPIIGDNYVEIGFGSGAVKITPAHDPNDFEVGLRHNLEVIRIMNDDGSLNDKAFEYNGLSREDARSKIVSDLISLGLMEKIEDYNHNVGECYRCNSTVEPIVSKQWFVKMQTLADPAIEVVKKKKIRFVPNRFEKIYFNWMNNIKDWCISRQLWWGHRIPAWYCDECGEVIVSKTTPTQCPKCKYTNLRQDEDVLDTWFSSALWPFSTLGYPDKTEELSYFYPTNVLVTAYDIIFFWVARMIFSGIEHMGQIPFPEVLIHGLVRDKEGRKMSKSLGNGVDPLILIDQYGADTLRFSLCNGVAPGSDIRFSEDRMDSCRNFMNKLWNASRFVLMNTENCDLSEINFRLNSSDKWILHKLNMLINEVNRNLKKYEIGLASQKLYEFVWNDFCDWYIELSKSSLYSDNKIQKKNTLSVLVHVLKDILKLMHPFTPFITEEIWKSLPNSTETLVLEKYPSAIKKYTNYKEFQKFEGVKEIIKSIRNVRAEMNVVPSKRIPISIIANDENYLKKNLNYILKLANVSELKFIKAKDEMQEKVCNIITNFGEIIIPMGDLIDMDKEIERLTKELSAIETELERSKKMLANKGFVMKAPKNLIEQEGQKITLNSEKCEKLKLRIAELKS